MRYIKLHVLVNVLKKTHVKPPQKTKMSFLVLHIYMYLVIIEILISKMT